MKRLLILIVLVLSFVSVNVYGWEMYVSNESGNSMLDYNQSGQLIANIAVGHPDQAIVRTNGNLYVAVGATGIYVDIVQGNNIVGSFSPPPPSITGGMAIGANNHLYICAQDATSVLIDEYDENDNFVRQFRCPGLQNTQDQLTVGPNGNIFDSENTAFYLNEIDLNGNIVNRVSTGSGSYPTGIAFGPDGYLYVGRDQYNDIAVYDPNTFVLVRTITGVAHPSGIAFDPENHHLFVVNWIGLPQITEYLYTGEFVGVFVSDGALSRPTMIVFKPTSVNTSTTTTICDAACWQALYEQSQAQLQQCQAQLGSTTTTTAQATNIELSTLDATPSDKQVILKWKTETEVDNAGFNVWRADNFVKINHSLIPALGSTVEGSDYDFVDQWVLNGKRYFYLLEDIDTNGLSTFHGPVKAVPRMIYGIGK